MQLYQSFDQTQTNPQTAFRVANYLLDLRKHVKYCRQGLGPYAEAVIFHDDGALASLTCC